MNRRRNTRKRKNIMPGIDNRVFFSIIAIALIIIIFCVFILGKKNLKNKKNVEEFQKNANNEFEQFYNETNNEIGSLDNYQTDKIIRISIVGDTVIDSKIESDSSDYDSIFEDAKEQLKDADIAIGTYSSDVKTDEDKKFATSVHDSGIDLLNIATSSNNDTEQFEQKDQNLKEIGFDTTGKYDENTENRVKIIEKRGEKIAIIAYNSQETSNVNYYDEEKATEDLNYAKENAKFTIVLMNWENKNDKVSKSQKKITDDLISKGANVVVGTNSCCLQSFEMTQNENVQGFVANSLGNYVSESTNEKSKLELILNLQIYIDKEGKSDIYKIDYTPMYMYNSKTKEENTFKIFNMKQEISDYEEGKENIDETTYKKLTKGIDDIKKILGTTEQVN